MAMSKDRIIFHLPRRYYTDYTTQNGMMMETCKQVLYDSFNIGRQESAQLMKSNPNGFDIACRPSQFARFIVRRYEANECINGIRDLKPVIVDRIPDEYDVLAKAANVDRNAVKSIITALRYCGNICDILKTGVNDQVAGLINVSDRMAKPFKSDASDFDRAN